MKSCFSTFIDDKWLYEMLIFCLFASKKKTNFFIEYRENGHDILNI